MKELAGWVIYTGIFLLVLLSGLALLTPVFPPAEIINHFRPFILLGTTGLLLLCFILKKTTPATISGLLLCFHLLLTFTSWSYSNQINIIKPGTTGNPLKLITFNIHFNNTSLDQTRQFLSKEQADIILFQEVTQAQFPFIQSLINEYPHQLSCAEKFGCNLAILSKKPWIKAEIRDRTDFTPPAVIATFRGPDQKFTVLGTHISWPLRPHQQVKDMIWLEKFVKNRKEPIIIAGDFNHTPWSWRLTRFAHSTGLKRHATFGASWPAGKLFPAFLIDHIFSSDKVENIETWTGPNLNSDHLPVISVIEIK